MVPLYKIVPQIPVLIPRALAGDPTAIVLLAAAGVTAAKLAKDAYKSSKNK